MSARFDSFHYSRPDLKNLEQQFDQLIAGIQSAASAQVQMNLISEINQLRLSFSTMYNLCYIRHTADTHNEFYEKENEFFDQHLPEYEALNNRFFKALLESAFRPELEQRLGKHLFTIADLNLKSFAPEIVADLQEENMLGSEYTILKSQASIQYNGEQYNLSSIYPLELSDDRQQRRSASVSKWQFYMAHQDKIEAIFDKMVQCRHRIAQKLGYDNFVQVGYARMKRSDYDPAMVANFRKQVREYIVPLASKLYERQRQRLGLDRLYWFDEEYRFTTGNPKPVGQPHEIVENASTMYRELSSDTHDFFEYMQSANLMDLVNRDGKAPGGYCTYMPEYKSPFIFSNFNGTSGDIDVLTHEAGHAFQVWSSGERFEFEEYHWPTSDAAEIHSMSMEFFTWPWMKLFFGAQTNKYHFSHMAAGLQFLPYGVAVDEFQHIIYENPDMTPAERNTAWRNLEKTYLPHRNYDGVEFLENGGYWQKQSHIFNSPFYYIDYTLAQICAFQFWMRDRQDHTSAWNDYVNLCRAGGSRSFLDLVKMANLRSPFEDGCVASVIGEIEQYLDSVDDSGF